MLIAISYSGSGSELLTILPAARRLGTPVVAMTGNAASELARQADIHLDVSVAQEACPMNLRHPPPARRPRWRWAMRWQCPAWKPAVSGRRISRARIRAAHWAGAC